MGERGEEKGTGPLWGGRTHWILQLEGCKVWEFRGGFREGLREGSQQNIHQVFRV